MARVAMYLQDKHEIREGMEHARFAEACGAQGFRCAQPHEVRPALQAALNSPKAALVEALVDVNEKPAKPEELRA